LRRTVASSWSSTMFFLESTFKDQINPKRQTAFPIIGARGRRNSVPVDLASLTLAEPDAETSS
jgi:hypothetical protein